MKTKIVLLFLLGWVGMAFGQNCSVSSTEKNGNSLEIFIKPFNKDNYPAGFKLKKGSTIKFVISNVNPLKVIGSNIEAKGENFQFEIPKSISDSFIGNEEKSEENNNKGRNPASSSFNSKEDFIAEYQVLIEKASNIERKANLNNILVELLGDNNFIKNVDSVKALAKKIYENTYEIDTPIEKDILELQKSYVELKKLYKDVNSRTDNISLLGTISVNGSKAKINDVKVSSTNVMFEEEMNSAKKIIDIVNEEKKKNEIINKAFVGRKTYETIKNDDFVTFTKATQLTDDEIVITPVLLGKDNKELEKFEPIKITTFGGVKVNFSTGYMLSFIGDDNYLLKYSSDGKSSGVYENEKNSITHAVGVLAHVFWDFGKTAMFGISSGISINTDAKLNFYAGPSVAFLEKNRLVFTGGLSFVNVKKLNRNNLDANDNFINPNYLDVSYSEMYKPAIFFAVTYNLFSNGNDNTKK